MCLLRIRMHVSQPVYVPHFGLTAAGNMSTPRQDNQVLISAYTSNQQVKDFYETRPAPGEWISPTSSFRVLLFRRYIV